MIYSPDLNFGLVGTPVTLPPQPQLYPLHPLVPQPPPWELTVAFFSSGKSGSVVSSYNLAVRLHRNRKCYQYQQTYQPLLGVISFSAPQPLGQELVAQSASDHLLTLLWISFDGSSG